MITSLANVTEGKPTFAALVGEHTELDAF
jgi:hypothetical protein